MRKYIWIIIFDIIVVVLVYGLWIEPRQLQINHLHVTLPELNELLSGRTAVHITDLHMADNGDQGRRVLEIIAEVQPDFIFLTGDYVQWNGNYEPAMEFLAKLQAKIGVWAVMGDYDYSNDRKSCLFCHEPGTGQPTKKHRAKFLRDSSEHIEIDGRSLQIIGVEGGNGNRNGGNGEGGWPELEGSKASIALVHNPLAFDTIPEDQIVLVLSGDTHGGQINLPRWIWSLLGYEKNAKYNHGLFQRGGNQMYVGRGVGTSHVKFRLMCRPEITILHF
jgi:uncharacterized protein